MKKIVIVLLAGCLISAASNDRFQQLLDGVKVDSVKRDLIEFQKGGIEKTVDISEYNADTVITYAKSFLGTKHKMGGNSKAGIDCSGLVMVSHAKVGIQLPHTSQEQGRFGIIVPKMEELQKGDLVFFYNSFKSKDFITHSGIYVGEGKFIHASFSKGVIISTLDDHTYWGPRYLFGTRFKE